MRHRVGRGAAASWWCWRRPWGSLVWLGTRAHHGTGKLPVKAPAGPVARPGRAGGLCRTAPTASTPLGRAQDEHPDAGLAIDGNAQHRLEDQQYYDATRSASPASALYIDAKPGTTARVLRDRSPTTPGFTAHDLRPQINRQPDTLRRPRLGQISPADHGRPRARTSTSLRQAPVPLLPGVDHRPRRPRPAGDRRESRCTAEGERARLVSGAPDSARVPSRAPTSTSRSSSRSYGIPLAANSEA